MHCMRGVRDAKPCMYESPTFPLSVKLPLDKTSVFASHICCMASSKQRSVRLAPQDRIHTLSMCACEPHKAAASREHIESLTSPLSVIIPTNGCSVPLALICCMAQGAQDRACKALSGCSMGRRDGGCAVAQCNHSNDSTLLETMITGFAMHVLPPQCAKSVWRLESNGEVRPLS